MKYFLILWELFEVGIRVFFALIMEVFQAVVPPKEMDVNDKIILVSVWFHTCGDILKEKMTSQPGINILE